MIDDRTPHHNLPLPSPANRLSEDVERLRSSLGMIDAWMASIEGLLTSDDISLDSLQELVTALKSDQSGVAGLVAQMAAITAALAAKAWPDADRSRNRELRLRHHFHPDPGGGILH